jgi:two-component system, chemotaxis family, chemotaxis protein CheY
MRVLVVDDSSTMRKFLKKILVEAGSEVLEAKHGRDALEVLRQNAAIDLTSIDWNMPEMDGMELLSNIRADHSFDSMQIMMVTTEMEMSGVARALEVGANEYVMKPFTKDVILEKLRLLGLLRESAPSAL